MSRASSLSLLTSSQIWTLPKLTLAFSTSQLATLDPILTDSLDLPAPSLPQDPPRKPQELDIDQLVIAPLGETRPHPHLIVSVTARAACPACVVAWSSNNDPPP